MFEFAWPQDIHLYEKCSGMIYLDVMIQQTSLSAVTFASILSDTPDTVIDLVVGDRLPRLGRRLQCWLLGI